MTAPQLPGTPSAGNQRIVFLGDIVGKPGLRIACNAVAWLRDKLRASAIIANAENAADGSGLRCKDYRRLTESGIDAITLGDHVFRKREITAILESADNIVRPLNLPPEAPGKTHAVVRTVDGFKVGVMCALGRVFMKPVDCPFRSADAVLNKINGQVDIRFFDFHAEATSDMQLMGRYLDGRVSAVLGTHTHVATADSQILPKGTAFQCDVGMTGPFESILGRRIEPVSEATLQGLPTPFPVASGNVRLNATWFDVDPRTGASSAIGRLDIPEAVIDEYRRRSDHRPTVL